MRPAARPPSRIWLSYCPDDECEANAWHVSRADAIDHAATAYCAREDDHVVARYDRRTP